MTNVPISLPHLRSNPHLFFPLILPFPTFFTTLPKLTGNHTFCGSLRFNCPFPGIVFLCFPFPQRNSENVRVFPHYRVLLQRKFFFFPHLLFYPAVWRSPPSLFVQSLPLTFLSAAECSELFPSPPTFFNTIHIFKATGGICGAKGYMGFYLKFFLLCLHFFSS